MTTNLNNNLPLVVIFGRTNVGKSTLFNCLIEKKQALVANLEGTTRDSNIGEVNWRDVNFILVDTGGIIEIKRLTEKISESNLIESKVIKQARDYVKRADLVLFLVDSKSGILSADRELSLFLKKLFKNRDKSSAGETPEKIILVANKADGQKERQKISEFYRLALGEPHPVSAAIGSGTGDLLDVIIDKLKSKKMAATVSAPVINEIRVSIIGKPNVGKSSLLNSLLGWERVIVSPIPHTTREPQDARINYLNQDIKLIDTAGINKKANKMPGLVKSGIDKSLRSLKKADITLLVMDITQEITHQDARLVEEIVNLKKSLIFIANKWDLINERDTEKYVDYIYKKLPFARFAPIQFTSALTKEKVKKTLDLVLEVYREKNIVLSESQLNKFIGRVVKVHRPAKGKGFKHPRIYRLTQIAANPPRFEVQIGLKEDLHFSYLRFLENRLRENFGFLGTPITIKIIKGKIKNNDINPGL